MLRVPPPSRIALGTATVAGQQVEVFIHPEWARYFDSITSQSNTTAAAVGLPGAPGTTGAAGVGVALNDSCGGDTEFIPGPAGVQGPRGDPGPALFMLQEQSGDDMPFVPAVNSNGVVGTATSDNALSGFVGEYVSSTFSGVAMGAAVVNLTSLSLPPGDWDVDGGVTFTGSVANMANAAAGFSTTSVAFGPSGTFFQLQGSVASIVAGASPTTRLSIAATTTVFFVGFTSFSSGTVTAAGIARARRVR